MCTDSISRFGRVAAISHTRSATLRKKLNLNAVIEILISKIIWASVISKVHNLVMTLQQVKVFELIKNSHGITPLNEKSLSHIQRNADNGCF